MAADNVQPNTPPPPTSDHNVADSHLKGKLDFVNSTMADTTSSENSTLILTVGDYARYYAKYVLSPLVREEQNCLLCLKRNSLNVREASLQQLQENTEIQNNIKDILGLQHGKIYENVKELRYRHLLIMANQGHDGSRIIGILINFLHYFWPSLLKVKSFMQMYIIPFVRAYHNKTNAVSSFYTWPEYSAWKEKLGNRATEYKMMGGPDCEGDAQSYLADFYQHTKDFYWVDHHDDDAIEFAFSQKKIEARYQWLQRPQEAFTYFDSKDRRIRYLDFINKQFMQYVVAADLQRSIPSMVDGLKPDQRKILFYAFQMPIIHEIEVAQFSAYVSDVSLYPHGEGEESIVGTINGMAQNYVGSNSINLLQLNGLLGTRLMGDKDHDASGRYIFTQLSPITPYLFDKDKDDKPIPHCLNHDGQSIEPAWFIPIIPMVLVNGSEGRGTECSSFIPNYNPRDIIANLKRLLEGKAVVPMIPNYNPRDITQTETTSKGTLCTTKGYFLTEDKNSPTNMHLFGSKGELKKYDTPEQILEDFYHLRLDLYEQRRSALVRELEIASCLLENKLKFIVEVFEGDIRLLPKREKDEYCTELRRKGFKSFPSQAVDNVEETEEEPGTGYDYLLYLPALSFTSEKIEELKQASDAMKKELEEITKSKSESLWRRDLNALDHQLDEEKYTLDERIAKIDFQSSQEEKYTLDECIAKIDFQSSQDVDESSPEIAEEASMNKKRHMW